MHSERRCGVMGYELTQTRSCVAWVSDFTSLSVSFLIGKNQAQQQLSVLF